MLRCRIEDNAKQDEFVLTLNDVGEQLHKQMYKKRKGQGVILNPVISMDQLKIEIEKLEAQ